MQPFGWFSGIIEKVGKNQYTFINTDPIYVGLLSSIKNKYLNLSRQYRTKEEVKHIEEVPQETLSIQSAIDFLKANGYLVFKQV